MREGKSCVYGTVQEPKQHGTDTFMVSSLLAVKKLRVAVKGTRSLDSPPARPWNRAMELTELFILLAVVAYIVGMLGREDYKRFFRGSHREDSTFDV